MFHVVEIHAGHLASREAAKVAVAKCQPPGPTRIATLADIDTAGLAPELQLDLVELWEQCDSWLQAQKQEPLAALATTPVGGDERASTWEVSAALRIAECTAHD
jgi:hypothetical protein